MCIIRLDHIHYCRVVCVDRFSMVDTAQALVEAVQWADPSAPDASAQTFGRRRIGILGGGAIGSVVGGMLSHDGHDVTIIDPWCVYVCMYNALSNRSE